jgi:diguanylate cyclase (GGDEF)-like protein
VLFRSRLVTTPVSRIVEGLHAVGAGDFTHPLEIHGSDEISLLAEAFDRMRLDLVQFVKDVEARDSHIEELNALRQNLQSINQSLNRRILELTMLNKIGAAVNATLEPRQLYDELTGILREVLEIDSFCLLLDDETTGRLEVKAHSGLDPDTLESLVSRREEGFPSDVMRSGRPRIVGDVSKDPDSSRFAVMHPEIRSVLIVPLRVHDHVIGVLHINSSKENAFSPYDLAFFSAVTNQLASAIENARLYAYQLERAVTDSLTNLCNHGCFQSRLNDEIARTLRYDRPLTLLMMDIDNFKRINDKFGHTTGDQVLREVARILIAQTRTVDIVSRYGGEEFTVILPETPLDSARAVAERIRAAIEADTTSIPDQQDTICVTISIGIAVFKGATDTQSELIERADQALYHAKDQGRNRIVVAET